MAHAVGLLHGHLVHEFLESLVSFLPHLQNKCEQDQTIDMNIFHTQLWPTALVRTVGSHVNTSKMLSHITNSGTPSGLQTIAILDKVWVKLFETLITNNFMVFGLET